MKIRRVIFSAVLLFPAVLAAQSSMGNPFTSLMVAAKAHALKHGALVPALSPMDASLLTTDP